MVVDTSAIVALIQDEPTAARIITHLGGDQSPTMPAPSATEAVIVLTARHGPVGRTIFERIRHEFNISITPYTEDHLPVAHRAYLAYGKGRHRAALNFGDCMVYAAARLADEPLLAVGDDFARTDLEFDGLVGYWRHR